MRHLREVVGESVVDDAHDPGAVAITDGPRIAEIEAREIFRDVRDDDLGRVRGRVEEAHADEVFLPIAARERPEEGMRAREVEGLRAGRWIDVAARPLGDAQQKDDLSIDLGGRRVEDGDDLELGLRRLDVARRDEGVLVEPDSEAQPMWASVGGSVSAFAGSRSDSPRMTSWVSARTRRPTFGHAISLP